MKKVLLASLVLCHMTVINTVSADEEGLENKIPIDLPISTIENNEPDESNEVTQQDPLAQIESQVTPNESLEEQFDILETETIKRVTEDHQILKKEINNNELPMEEIVDLTTRPVLLNATDQIIEVEDGSVKLQTPSGIVVKRIEDIGGKQLSNGKHEITDKSGKKILLPKMNEKASLLFQPLILFLTLTLVTKLKSKARQNNY